MTTLTLSSTTTQSSTTTRIGTAFVWTLQVAAAAMFLFAGGLKLAGVPLMVHEFGIIGLGQWFRYFTGGLEVISAVSLLVPSLAFFGALALAATMVGAIITHLFIIGGSPAVPIVLLATTAAIAWARSDY